MPPQKRGFLVLQGREGDRIYLSTLGTFIEIGAVYDADGNIVEGGQVRVCFPKSAGHVDREKIYRKKLENGEVPEVKE